MFIKSIKFIFIIVLGMLFGCGPSGSGTRPYFSRMNSQSLADIHARLLWQRKNFCEESKSGVSRRDNLCESFEELLAYRKKSCELYKSGSTDVFSDPISCEILDIYEVKYKNMPAPEPGRTVRAPAN